MKPFLTACGLALAIMLIQVDLPAQPAHGLAARMILYNYLFPLDNDNADLSNIVSGGEGRGFELAYYYHFGRGTHLGIPLKFGTATVLQENGIDRVSKPQTLGNLDVILHQNLFRYGGLLQPNLHVGLGSTYNFDAETFDFGIPAGIGLNVRLLRNLYLNGQTQYRFSFDDKSGWHHGLGLVAYFGRDPDDRDADGVMNADDRCPDVAGPTDKMGCPDRDNDNVVDIDDRCPDVAGMASMMGCPDRDNDSVADMDDACPDLKGLAAMMGCPDSDSDGLADPKDGCPNQAGPATNNGCPITDRDNDGVPDVDDACPDAVGSAATRGCPDRDNDGVIDRDDLCPDLKGAASSKGCPDTDGDGVTDNDDRCVTLPGPASNRGCPELKREDKEIIDLAVRRVQFNSGKATLKPESFKVLNDVAGVLKRNPQYSVAIKGHTDSQGEAPFNLDLSMRRAKTCLDYLVSQGVPADKISSTGFGETLPIANNINEAGRSQNRRVEFELYIK